MSSTSPPSPTVFTHLRGLLLLLPWLACLLLADLLLSLLLLIKPLFPDLVYDASSLIAFTIWRWIQLIFEVANGGEIQVSSSGDAPSPESAIVVANHVAWCDFYMVQALALRAGMLGRCRWFAKIQLRWVPFLGWGLWAMGMPMVSRRWMRDRVELDRVFSGIVERRWPVCRWLFLFVLSFSFMLRFTGISLGLVEGLSSRKHFLCSSSPLPSTYLAFLRALLSCQRTEKLLRSLSLPSHTHLGYPFPSPLIFKRSD